METLSVLGIKSFILPHKAMTCLWCLENVLFSNLFQAEGAAGVNEAG